MVRVLFVCLGNICRSPMAEAIFLSMVREKKLQSQIEVDSAGTGSWHIGDRPHQGTLDVLSRNGIPADSRARQVRLDDLTAFDYVITMDDSNTRNVLALSREAPRAHVARLLDFVADMTDKNVPDPYFTGDFDGVYKLVREGCARLLNHIQVEHSL